MRPPAPLLPGLATTLALLLGLIATYVVTGWLRDRHADRRERVRGRAYDALSALLFQPTIDAAAAAEHLASVPRDLLLELAQRLASDLNGEADERLRKLVASAGLSRQIHKLITSRSWRNRAQGASLASLLGEGHPNRVALLSDPHPLVRARAAESLEGADVVAQVERLVWMLDDDVVAVRFAAQQALLRSDARIVPTLERYLSTADGTGIGWALEIAANLPDPRLVPAIERHIRSDDPERRALATEAMVPWLDDAAVLVELLDDPDATVRATAARAAGTAKAQLLAARVGRLLSDRSWQVREQAGRALAAMGPAGTMTLRIHTDDPDPYARDMAVLMLDTLAAANTATRPAAARAVAHGAAA